MISAIYLFGSHASEHDRPKSDIDLGVLFSDDVDGFTRINMETEISNKLKKMSILLILKKVARSCGTRYINAERPFIMTGVISRLYSEQSPYMNI